MLATVGPESSALIGYEEAIECGLGTIDSLAHPDLSFEPIEVPHGLTTPILLLFLI